MNIENLNHKSGFITIIGRPSSGKSTLINCIIGNKISIVSKHPQTTRFIVKGIYSDDDCQMIFLDTPGYHNFNSLLNKKLSDTAVRGLDESDLILYIVDISREFGDEESQIIEILKPFQSRVIIAFNKIDINPDDNFNIKDKILKELTPVTQLQISAKEDENITDLIKTLKSNLKEGPIYYPKEYVTDQSIPFRASEVVREQVFNLTSNEIPHSVYVKVTSCDITDEKITIHATIFVERKSQKGMLIGKSGVMIKKIGTKSRAILKDIFEKNVNLFLDVDIHEKWRKDEQVIKKIYNL